jgi:phosphoribosylformylglycinamidine synthase PurS subunit
MSTSFSPPLDQEPPDPRPDTSAFDGLVGCTAVAKVVVDVMPKPEILDPQGQAVTGALARLGIIGVADVRQGKHFELEVDDTIDDATLERIAGQLLANPVIEDWRVTRS